MTLNFDLLISEFHTNCTIARDYKITYIISFDLSKMAHETDRQTSGRTGSKQLDRKVNT